MADNRQEAPDPILEGLSGKLKKPQLAAPKYNIWDQTEDRETRLDRQNILTNAVEDAVNLAKGLWAMGGVIVDSAIEIGGGLDELTSIDPSDVGAGVAENANLMLKGLVDSVEKWHNPGRAIHNHPIESLLDVAALAGLVGGGLRLSGQAAAKAGMPMRLGKRAIKSLDDLERASGGKLPTGSFIQAVPEQAFIPGVTPRALPAAQVQQAAGRQVSRAGAVFDLERFGESLAKFPFGMIGEQASAATRGLRARSPLFNDLMAWSGISAEARAVSKLNAKRMRTSAAIKMKGRVAEINKLKLLPDENKILLYRASGAKALLDNEADLARLVREGVEGAKEMQDLIPVLRKNYDDIIKKEAALTPERRAVLDKAEKFYVEDLRLQEELFRQAGVLNPEQFRRAEMRFLANEYDEAARLEKIAIDKDLVGTKEEILKRLFDKRDPLFREAERLGGATEVENLAKINAARTGQEFQATLYRWRDPKARVVSGGTFFGMSPRAIRDFGIIDERQLVSRLITLKNPFVGKSQFDALRVLSSQGDDTARNLLRAADEFEELLDDNAVARIDRHVSRRLQELGHDGAVYTNRREVVSFKNIDTPEKVISDKIASGPRILDRKRELVRMGALKPVPTRGERVDQILRVFDKLKNRPEYVPIATVERRIGLALAAERLKVRSGGTEASKHPIFGRLEQGERITLRRLLDDPDLKSSLDELSFKNISSAAEFKATVDFLQEVASHPRARRLSGDMKLRPGEVYYTPDIYNKYGSLLVEASDDVIKEMKKLGITDFSADGLLRAWPKIKDGLIRKADDGLAKGEVAVYAIPEDMAIAVNRSLSKSSLFMEVTYDRLLDLWKNTVLLYNPGWYIQNLVGNIFLTFMGGVGVTEQLRAAQNLRRLRVNNISLPDELLTGMQDDIAVIGRKMAARHKGPIARTSAAMGTALGSDALRKIATAMERGGIPGLGVGGRNTAFVSLMRKRIKSMQRAGIAGERAFKSVDEVLIAAKGTGVRASAARDLVQKSLDDVNTYLFDYFNLHPFERQLMRRVFPFWTWVRNTNILLGKAAKDAFAQPLKFLAYQRMSKMSFDLLDDQDFPQWLKGHVLLGGGQDGSFLFFNLRRYNPFFGIGLQALTLSSVNPFIKVVYEMVAGKNVWTEKPFRSNEVMMTYSGRQLRYNPETGRFTEKPYLPPIHSHILNQFPQHTWLNRMINPFVQTDGGNVFQPEPIRDINGRPKFERDFMFSALQAAGIPLVSVGRKQINDMRVRKLKWTKFSINKLKSLMKSRPADERRLYLEAIRDIANDRKKWVEFE